MKYTKLGENIFKLEDPLDEKYKELKTFIHDFVETKDFDRVNIGLSLMFRLSMMELVVNDFISLHRSVLKDNVPISITINLDGRIFTITVGYYNGELLYNLDT